MSENQIGAPPTKGRIKASNRVKAPSVQEYEAIIEAYKEKNPVKYEAKKKALEARLQALKPKKEEKAEETKSKK